MPRTKVALRSNDRKALHAQIAALAFKMEEPLAEATGFVRALWLMGISAGPHDEEGHAIQIVALAAAERLDALKADWRRMCRAVRREKRRST